MAAKIAARMNRMAPSGIRKVNEKALAMERAGERVLHFEIGRPTLTPRSTSSGRRSRPWPRARFTTPPTSA